MFLDAGGYKEEGFPEAPSHTLHNPLYPENLILLADVMPPEISRYGNYFFFDMCLWVFPVPPLYP